MSDYIYISIFIGNNHIACCVKKDSDVNRIKYEICKAIDYEYNSFLQEKIV